MIGTQEIIALLIVLLVVSFALYRRLRKKKTADGSCSGCEQPASEATEKPVRFYRKQR